VKVVLDTNVLMSGIFFGGSPAKVLDAWLGAGQRPRRAADPGEGGFDEYYLKNRTLLLDLKIILLTAKKVRKDQGGGRDIV